MMRQEFHQKKRYDFTITLLSIFGKRKNCESDLFLGYVLFSLNWGTLQMGTAFSFWGHYQDRRVITTSTTQSIKRI